MLNSVALVIFAMISLFPQPVDANCEPPTIRNDLEIRDGYVAFLDDATLAPLKQALPTVSDESVQQALQNPNTMFYDEESMVFVYQDSVEVVVGGRANCVGRVTGENNRGSVIGKLMNLFGPDYRFRFPFRKAAGTDDVENSYVLNFWLPPSQGQQTLPVKWWKASRRGRWHWVFPVGTLFGEILFQRSPSGQWVVFEIRTRLRYLDGWAVDLFRPFATSIDLAKAIQDRRPTWQNDAQLVRMIDHLSDSQNLTRHTLRSDAFHQVFDPIDGALDHLPALNPTLVTELLTQTPFRSMKGQIWKEGAGLETYGPSSLSNYNIVPAGYKMGMIPVNEVSCNRCHVETGHPLGDFEGDVVLYGEVWGEDRIFTWHLFKPHRYIYNTFDDSDSNSRTLNPKLVQAKLLKNERVSAGDPLYRQLPVPY